VTGPAKCALAFEHAAETLDRAGPATERHPGVAAAAESLRDAARVIRCEESAFVIDRERPTS
jgi:hypothetical protein